MDCSGDHHDGRPPRLPFLVTLGVSGHRTEAFSDAAWTKVRAAVKQIFDQLGNCAADVHGQCSDLYDDGGVCFRVVTPLAEGSDQLVAEVALERGWRIDAVLPFAAGAYRDTMGSAVGRSGFDRLLEASASRFVLPGDPDDPRSAYVMAGRATLAHCSILVAIWDGLPARGKGGTADVVKSALERGNAVIHLNPARPEFPRLIWSAFDPVVFTREDDGSVSRPLTDAALCEMLSATYLPPPGADERDFLRLFLTEAPPRWQWRIEYPLMLGLLGAKRPTRGVIDDQVRDSQRAAEWADYRARCAKPQGIDPPLDLLERAYSAADRLAIRFAQAYRSGHVFAFVFGALAVVIGLSAFINPHWQLQFAAIELVVTFAVIFNGWIGNRQQWHRRWLDYRQLADRLRLMRSLNLLAVAAPEPPGTPTNPVPRRWIDSYAIGVWRALGIPSGALTQSGAAVLADSIAEQEIAPQVAYHRRNAAQVDVLDSRLGGLATSLFVITLIVSIATVAGTATNAQWVNDYSNWLTLVSAGFPALGTAVFGIRFQADFGGDAVRSLSTAGTLERFQDELERGVGLSRAADLLEQAGRVMLADLDEWRLVNQQRELEMG